MLTVLDEYTRQALAVEVRIRMGSQDVLKVLYGLFLRHGMPEFVRSDNGPEFVSQATQSWLDKVGVKPIRIYPGSPLSGHRQTMPFRAVPGRTATTSGSTAQYAGRF